MTTLAERLGYGPDARLLIINADDLGMCQSANAGIYDALRTGIATSASLMMPAPWSREAAHRYRGEDVGVHLTLNAEFEYYRWSPITHAPSLLDGDGGFPRTVGDVTDHADLDEVRRELRAQVERAILWGFDISHLSSHLFSLQWRPEFFDVFLDLAIEFRLPIRMVSGPTIERDVGFPFRQLAADQGVLFPDHLALCGVGTRPIIEDVLSDLQPGVTEIYVHPAVDSAELRAFAPDWALRVDDLDLVTTDRSLRAMLDRLGVIRIGYRALRDAMRS